MKTNWFFSIILTVILISGWSMAWGQNVIITPLGSHANQFCRNDRALLFQDPNGTTVLYDPGRTIAGAGDTRVGAVNVMILSSVHADHIGDVKAAGPDAGTCANPQTVSAAPNSNFAEIAAAKGSTVIVGGEMHTYLNAKIAAAGGSNTQAQILRHGGKRTIGGVTFAVITAHHSNGVPPDVLSQRLKNDLVKDGLTAYVGPETGFVLTFSNGLVVYLSGDTGHTSDMATIVRDYYKAKVAVMHMGDIFSMGPEEAAFAVNQLIQPVTAIAEHANEASTGPGNLGARVTAFIAGVNPLINVIVPFSGVAISCDGAGNCV